jgi:hypothetical protein
MKGIRGIALVCMAALVVVALSGCGLIARNAVENATGVKVDQSGKNVTVTGKNGETASLSSQTGKLPDGLPSYVPSYAGTIRNAASISTDQGTNFSYAIDTNDSVSTINGWYKDKLKADGWTVTLTASSGPDQTMIQAKKGDKTNIIVTIGKKEDTSGNEITTIVEVQK